MPQIERLKREIFTRKLIKICQRLDEANVREMKETSRHRLVPRNFRLRLTHLWVVGSYARGASFCGDLDVVFQVESLSGGIPYAGTMGTAFFGKMPYISPFYGTPESNSSGVSFTDAISIWSGVGCDWQSAISAIAIDPLAGRATRAIDAIPLNTEQLVCDSEKLARIVSLREQGVLEWEFIPFDVQKLAVSEATPLPRKQGSLGWYVDRFGKKTQQLLHLLAEPMATIEPFGKWFFPDIRARNEVQCGSTLIVMGLPHVPIHRLDDNLAIRQLLIVPHLSKRGPNGAWLIKRGSRHPDVTKLADKCVFYLSCKDAPNIISYYDGTGKHPIEANILELFSSSLSAQEMADTFNDDDDDEYQLIVTRVESSAILALTGLAQVVEFDGHPLPTSLAGRHYAECDANAGISDLVALIEASGVNIKEPQKLGSEPSASSTHVDV